MSSNTPQNQETPILQNKKDNCHSNKFQPQIVIGCCCADHHGETEPCVPTENEMMGLKIALILT